MRLVASALACGLLAAAGSPPQSAPPRASGATPSTAPATATVRGRVTADRPDLPIRKARVSLTGEGTDSPDDVYTDSDGRFEFTRLPAGRYTAWAWKTGYVSGKYGAHTLWDREVRIVVATGAVVNGIDIALSKGAAIAGRIVDDRGGPMAGVTVTALRVTAAGGRVGIVGDREGRTPVSSESTTSDDLGEYRIGSLPPATYVISAYGSPAITPAIRQRQQELAAALRGPFASPADRMEVLMRARPSGGPHQVFYPQSAFIGQAQPLTINAGEETAGVDLALTYDVARPTIIAGRIVDPAGGAGRMSIAISHDGGGIPELAGGLVSGTGPDGTFGFPVDPGEYTVYAEGAGGGIAIQHVSVGAEDVDNVQLVLRKPARVSGRVVIEGTAKPRISPLAIEAWSPSEMLQYQRRSIAVVRNGAFSFDDLIGRRVFRLSPAQPGLTITGMTLAGQNVLDIPVEFKGGENITDAAIVLSATAAQVAGMVTDPDRKPVSDVSVVLFAEDRRQLPRRAYWVRPDTTGRFVIGDLAAGDYLIALAAEVDDTQWSTTSYLDTLRAGATKVSLANHEQKTLALTWSRSPR